MGIRRTLWMVGLALIVAGSSGSPLVAGDLNFEWDPSSGATGYRLYYGSSAGQYSDSVDVGGTTQTSLNTLPDCTAQYYAVTAYNSAGESGFSNEVSSWPRPVVSGTNQPSADRGATLDLVLTGTNYQTGVQVSFSSAGISINGPGSVDSCNQLTVNITIDALADLGPTNITVTDPGGVAGTGTGLFTVTDGGGGPDLPQVQNLRRTDVQP